MPQQYANHRRIHPSYHYVLLPVVILITAGSLVYAWRAWVPDGDRLGPLLLVGIALALILLSLQVREYAAKVQDRAIRAEENLRHYVLTGKLLDPALTPKQIVALRFADDGQFPELAQKAAETAMPPVDIKKSVKNWRADYYRI